MPRSKNPFAEELPPTDTIQTEIPTSSSQLSVPVSEFAQLLAAFNTKMNESNVMFVQKLNEAVEAARKPPYDPVKEKQKERAIVAKKTAEDGYWAAAKDRAHNCTHMRNDLTSAIAWARQSDGVTRGPCMHCGTLFSPIRGECVSQEIFDSYKERIRIPSSRADSVVYIS